MGKKILFYLQIPGKKTTKLWVPDEEVSPETMAKVSGEPVISSSEVCRFLFFRIKCGVASNEDLPRL